MKSVRIIPDTSDIKLLIKASSRHELFNAGLMGLDQLMADKPAVRKYEMKQTFTVESSDLTHLFVDFLNSILDIIHRDSCIYDKVNSLIFEGNTQVTVELEGFILDSFKKEFKSVNHHDTNIRQSGAGLYEVIIVLTS